MTSGPYIPSSGVRNQVFSEGAGLPQDVFSYIVQKQTSCLFLIIIIYFKSVLHQNDHTNVTFWFHQ